MLVAESTQGNNEAVRITQTEKKLKDTIGNRTQGFPAYSIVLQLTNKNKQQNKNKTNPVA
jgi:hypothetical protein